MYRPQLWSGLEMVLDDPSSWWWALEMVHRPCRNAPLRSRQALIHETRSALDLSAHSHHLQQLTQQALEGITVYSFIHLDKFDMFIM